MCGLLGVKCIFQALSTHSSTVNCPALWYHRSSSSGAKRPSPRGRGRSGRRSLSGPKRAQTTPQQEREATLRQFINPTPPPAATPSKKAPAQAVRVVQERKPEPEPSKPDIATISRKVVSIIEELVNNSDFKVHRKSNVVLQFYKKKLHSN